MTDYLARLMFGSPHLPTSYAIKPFKLRNLRRRKSPIKELRQTPPATSRSDCLRWPSSAHTISPTLGR
jgi:hypothetical protein